jgi:hypothetical protein
MEPDTITGPRGVRTNEHRELLVARKAGGGR